MHTICLQPSLFHYSRSRTHAPPMAERFILARYPDCPQHPPAVAFAGAYHPIVRALAKPGCTGYRALLPAAVMAQACVDVLAGAAAMGCLLLCLGAGRAGMARALLYEHRLQFVAMATAAFTLGMAAAVGGAVGYAAFLMA